MIKKAAACVLVLMVLLLSFILSLPALLSTNWGMEKALSWINSGIPGRLDVQKINLGWFQDQTLSGVSLKDKSQTTIASFDTLTIGSSLAQLFFSHSLPENIKLVDLSASIIHDEFGATNLEQALGLKTLSLSHSQPVTLERLNIESRSEHGETRIKAVGLTMQNNLKGRFLADVVVGQQTSIQLNAENFPLLVIDQLLAFRNPKLSGVVKNLLGESIDLRLEQIQSEGKSLITLIGKTPSSDMKVSGHISASSLQINPESYLTFNLDAEALGHLFRSLEVPFCPSPQPLQGQLSIGPFEAALVAPLEKAVGQFHLKLEPWGLGLKDCTDMLSWKTFSIKGKSLESVITLHLETQSSFQGDSGNGNLHLSIPKSELLNALGGRLFGEGISFSIEGDGKVKSLESLTGPGFQFDAKGAIKNEKLKGSLQLKSEKLSWKNVEFEVDDLDFRPSQWKNLREINGLLVIHEMVSTLPYATVLQQFQKITLPWEIELQERYFKISTIAENSTQTHQNIKGSLRWLHWDKPRPYPELHIDLHFNHVSPQFLSEVVEERQSIEKLLGPEVSGTLTLLSSPLSSVQGQIKLQTGKTNGAFLKSLTADATLAPDKDLSFHFITQQAVGSADVQGTFADYLDPKGKWALEDAKLSVKGTLSHFPLALLSPLLAFNPEAVRQAEAMLGSQVDAELFVDIRNHQGPIQASLKGLNGEMYLDGKVNDKIFMLNKPLTATLKITPQFEHLILKKLMPLFSSVKASNQPIQLRIENEGFLCPLKDPSLAALELAKGSLTFPTLEFTRDSDLGKVISILGFNAQHFEVKSTPAYFSLQKGKLNLQRTDLLIADSLPLAAWGKADLEKEKLQMVIGITGKALKSAFPLKGIKNNYMLQVTLSGPLNSPQLDSTKAAARLSALIAQSEAGPKGQLIGKVIDVASDVISKEPVPPPTTNPLPWQNLMEEGEPEKTQSENSPQSTTQEEVDRSLHQLKKGAKKLLKELLPK